MHLDRLTETEALDLLVRAPQIELMGRADHARWSLFPEDEVTFVFDTNPNYTNACETACTFCSFYRKPTSKEVYVVEPRDLAQRIARAAEQGATTVLLQGGHHPEIPFEYYFQVIDEIRLAAPTVHIHPFSPAEIAHIAKTGCVSTSDVLQRLYDSGIRTMPGGGAEILVDRVRRAISPKKIMTDEWLDVMRDAHRIGFKTTATMTYGHLETPAEIVEHLLRIRALQDETGGFYAFIPWSFKPGDSPLSKLVPDTELSSYYVRVIAVARLVLDNFPHIQGSWFGEGWRAGQLSLHAGADDFGGLLLEENVLFQAQHRVATTLENVLTTIREAGFTPVQRTTDYRKIRRYEKSTETTGNPVLERTETTHQTHAPVI